MNAKRRNTPSLVRRALWWAAAVDGRVMVHPDCRGDWVRYSIAGAAVMATGLLAVVGASVVAHKYYAFAGSAALVVGLVWGAIIVTVDRLLLVTLVKEPGVSPVKLGLIAAPRVGLALLAALAVSVPAELVLFARRLDLQLSTDQQAAVQAFQERLTAKYDRLPRIVALEQDLRGEIAAKEEAAALQFLEVAREGDGTGGSGRSGRGFRYDAKMARYRALEAETEQVRAMNRQRMEELRAQRKAGEQALREELAAFQSQADVADDLLARLMAMRRLKADPVVGATVSMTGWVIRLLAMLLELLPITTKLLSRRGPYEAAFLAQQERQCARWDARRRIAVRESVLSDQQQEIVAGAVAVTSRDLVEKATAEAMTSEEATEPLRELTRHIIDRSVRVARQAAVRVFDDNRLERDVTEAALRFRKEADERVVHAEARKANVFVAFRRALGRITLLRAQDQRGRESESRQNGAGLDHRTAD